MKDEQIAYLNYITQPGDSAHFEAFLKCEKTAQRISKFETIMQRTWSEFVSADTHAVAMTAPEGSSETPEPSASQRAQPSSVMAEDNPVGDRLGKSLGRDTASQPSSSQPTGQSAHSEADREHACQAGNGPAPQSQTVATSPVCTPPSAVTRRILPSRPSIRLSIRNARQGEAFDETIVIEPAASKIQLLTLSLPDGLGLSVDAAHWRLHGSPRLSGDIPLDLHYRHMDDPSWAIRKATFTLIVNPDPKLLWQDLPSDPDAPFWKADNAHSLLQGRDATMVAARRRGRSHAHKGTCCDDDFVIQADPAHGWHLAVVADGAGSAKFSRRGSELVTRTASDFLSTRLASTAGDELLAAMQAYACSCDTDSPPADDSAEAQTLRNKLFVTLGYAAHAAVKALAGEADTRSDIIEKVRDLSTTLLIGLTCKVGNRWICAAYWVGDGVVGVYRQNQEVILLGEPDSGEYSGQTRFLSPDEVTQEALVRRLRFTCVEDFTAMTLMTDGVSDPKFPSESQLGKLEPWDALWQEMDAATELSRRDTEVDQRLLEWLNFWVPGEYDDRTIAIIY